ncbi:hypothetical protein [Streptomyces candidus]|uniref:Uncharacterized protein n=1 Tax=Streptomyces candidus TaxID=67283 RepID=A0A7X0HMA5_9ACTN|nr:hypothetical protein [Streptomyces candidus]MBB6440271.1 hypothetical protein [Streptomyces candidus]GHH58350.1 hypothetical protein GCM10018773_66500 [Streptomyces candidus]
MRSDKHPTEPMPPMPLAPLDEAYLAHAQTCRDIASRVLGFLPVQHRASDPEHGREAERALAVLELAEQLVTEAVVIERERKASWSALGDAAGISKQSAHERWSAHIGQWTRIQRRRRASPALADPAAHAQDLDDWYTGLVPGEPRAVSGGLISLRDPGARQAADELRTEALQLYVRLDQLKKEEDRAFEASFATPAADSDAGHRRTAWAGVHFAKAEAYDRLAVAEAPLAAEHRRAAAAQRSIARDILAGRPAGPKGSGGQ